MPPENNPTLSPILAPTTPPKELFQAGTTDIPPAPRTPSPASPSPVGAAKPASPAVPGGYGQVPPSSGRSSSKIVFIVIAILALGILGAISILIPRLTALTQPIDLTWWGLWEDQTIMAPLIAEYQQKNPKVKITYINQAKEDYRERLTSSLARGQGPDIFRIHNTWLPMFWKDLDTIPSSVMSASDYAKTFYPAVVSDMAKGSSFAGIPLGFDTLALYINEDIFDINGKTPPTTWDDLRSVAQELTVKDPNGTIRQSGVALGVTENVDHWPEILSLLMLQNRASLSDPTNQLAYAALDFYTRFYRADRVWDPSLPSSTIAFAGGKVAMYFGPSWRALEIKQLNPTLKFKVLPAPQLPKERPDEPNIYFASYWAEGVWSESKNKAAAWDFLKFLSTKESLQKFYQKASTTRTFGEPYPRIDMQDLLIKDPLLGAFVAQAKEAKTWYLVSRTFSGPTGINSQLIKYYEDAVNAVTQKGDSPENALRTAATGVSQVLSQYGIAKTPAIK